VHAIISTEKDDACLIEVEKRRDRWMDVRPFTSCLLLDVASIIELDKLSLRGAQKAGNWLL